jgi:multidrug efflux system membrane fusion protein
MARRIVWTVLIAATCLAILVAMREGLLVPKTVTRDAPATIPVVVAEVKRADVPVYLTALGTVQAYNSVLVKSRVDGQIVRINFEQGREVRAGDVLVEIDPSPLQAALEQAQAARLKDQAQLENARRDLDRASRLAVTGSGTAQQADTTKALVAQLEASIKSDEALIDMAQIQLNYSKIRSPIDGRVGTRLVDIGNIVRASDTGGIVTVNQIHPIYVDFALPAESLPKIRSNLSSGDVVVIAEDNGGKELAAGKLTVVDNQINATTATIHYKATFENADEVLWPGQFVNIRVLLQVLKQAITMPTNAVQRGPDGPYVFMIDRNNVTQKRSIRLVTTEKNVAIVDDGAQPGDRVVTDGQYRIQDGSLVQVVPQPGGSPG